MDAKIRGKWVEELMIILPQDTDLNRVSAILDKADVLLQISACETDNEFLHDNIMKLLIGVK